MTTTTTGIAATTPDRQAEDRVDAASRTVHAAEGQLHTARESGVPTWQSAAAQTLHAALDEYLAAQAALGHRHAVPLVDAPRPGWRVQDGQRSYIVWAPRAESEPNATHATTAGAGLLSWAACYDSEKGFGGEFWRAATLDGVLAQMPDDVAAAFRAAVQS